VGGVAPASDPGAPLRKRLESCWPAGSEARERLGEAIARLRGEAAGGSAAESIASETIATATSVATVAKAARPSAGLALDGMERARPASLAGTALAQTRSGGC
jgi:hypothetical protein